MSNSEPEGELFGRGRMHTTTHLGVDDMICTMLAESLGSSRRKDPGLRFRVRHDVA